VLLVDDLYNGPDLAAGGAAASARRGSGRGGKKEEENMAQCTHPACCILFDGRFCVLGGDYAHQNLGLDVVPAQPLWNAPGEAPVAAGTGTAALCQELLSAAQLLGREMRALTL